MIASDEGHTATVELLLTHGADINAQDNYGRTALDMARNEEIRQLLLNYCVNNAKEQAGSTALIWASRKGDTATVELLLTHGADISAKDNYGYTALMWASQNGHTAIVELLLTHGADINAQNDYGYTALMYASQNGHTATVELLRRHGAN